MPKEGEEEEQNGLIMFQNEWEGWKRQGRQQEKEMPMVLDRTKVQRTEQTSHFTNVSTAYYRQLLPGGPKIDQNKEVAIHFSSFSYIGNITVLIYM